MHINNYFVNLLLLFCVAVASADIRLRPIYPEHITRYEQRVSQELKYNSYLRHGISVGFLLSSSYACYQLFGGSDHKIKDTNLTITPTLAAQFNRAQQALIKLEETQHSNNELGKKRHWSADWGRWICSQIGSQVLFAFISYMVSNSMNPFMKYFRAFDAKVDGLVNRIYYTPNMHWFLNTRCPLTALFSQLENDATRLQLPVEQLPVPETVHYWQNSFIDHWTLCVQQNEALLGFMQYKIGQCATVDIQNRQKNIVNFIQEIWTNAKQHIEKQLNTNQNDTILAATQTLRETINRHISEFALLESLTIY